jgi:hypothetical protein
MSKAVQSKDPKPLPRGTEKRFRGKDIKDVYASMAYFGRWVEYFTVYFKDGSRTKMKPEHLTELFRRSDFDGTMAVKYFHVVPTPQKIFSFVDMRHGTIYNVTSAKTEEAARKKLAKKLIGKVFDADMTEKELWCHIAIADDVKEI